jgi:hypothetical protein
MRWTEIALLDATGKPVLRRCFATLIGTSTTVGEVIHPTPIGDGRVLMHVKAGTYHMEPTKAQKLRELAQSILECYPLVTRRSHKDQLLGVRSPIDDQHHVFEIDSPIVSASGIPGDQLKR